MAAMPLRPGGGGGVFRPEPPAQNAKRIVRVAREVLHKLYPDEVLRRVAETPAQIFKALRTVVHLHKDDLQLAEQLVDALDKQEYVLAVLYLKGGVRLTVHQLHRVLCRTIEANGNIHFPRIPPPDTLIVLIRNDLFETTESPGEILMLLILDLQRNERPPLLNQALFALPQVLEALTLCDQAVMLFDRSREVQPIVSYTPDQNKLRLASVLNLHEEVRLLLAQGVKLHPSLPHDVELIQELILLGRLEMLEKMLQSGGMWPDLSTRRAILAWLVDSRPSYHEDSRSPYLESAHKLLVQAGWEQ